VHRAIRTLKEIDVITMLRTCALMVCAGSVVLAGATSGNGRADRQEKPKATAGTPQKAPPAAPQRKAAGASTHHTALAPGDLQWGPAPPSLPPGAQVAVVDGDPAKAGPFAMRVKFPAGYKVPPHWHPTEENIVVLSGVFKLGTGEKADEASMKALPAGGFAKIPRRMAHYAMAEGETVIHLSGTGPFAITYVNPKDDPRKKTQP
jgi:quercetin dioxygenase-like cupin family protein